MSTDLSATLTAWRRHLHANPGLTLHEGETAAFVVAGGQYDGLINLAVAGLLLSALAMIAPALALDRQRPPA